MQREITIQSAIIYYNNTRKFPEDRLSFFEACCRSLRQTEMIKINIQPHEHRQIAERRVIFNINSAVGAVWLLYDSSIKLGKDNPEVLLQEIEM